MSGRKIQRRARVLALQALYAEEQQTNLLRRGSDGVEPAELGETELASEAPAGILQFSWLDRKISDEEAFLARALVQGVRRNRIEIDEVLTQHLVNWALDRLLIVDRSILRLGTYMLQYLRETPEKVIIDECIKLCHDFSSEESYRLVNGVLHNVAEKFRS